MTLSLSKKNVLSVMTMTLTMISLISPADAQTTCSSTSPDCCWVVESWKKMGKTTSVDPTSSTACCYILLSQAGKEKTQTSGIPWVHCTSDGSVLRILWSSQRLLNSIPSELKNLRNLRELRLNGNRLTGSIPSWLGELKNLEYLGLGKNQLSGSIPIEIGNLKTLQSLWLSSNKLNGSIPSSLGKLTKIGWLYLQDNPGLTGTFAPPCRTHTIWISGTSIIICGCAAASTPPTIFPPPGTHADCLSSGPALTLSKRTLAFSQVIGGRSYTCNTDSNKNPFADCLNSMAKICDPAGTSFNKITCQTGVNQMFASMGTHWRNVRKECGQWPFTQNGISYTGVYPSENCARANKNLIENAYYTFWDPLSQAYEKAPVLEGLPNSMKTQLWSQVTKK